MGMGPVLLHAADRDHLIAVLRMRMLLQAAEDILLQREGGQQKSHRGTQQDQQGQQPDAVSARGAPPSLVIPFCRSRFQVLHICSSPAASVRKSTSGRLWMSAFEMLLRV